MGAGADPPAVEASAPSMPARLGPYTLERRLGRGAMGALYLGRDPADGRPVAIKTLQLGDAFEPEALAEARSRFEREAQTAQRLHHPDIVAVFGSGEAHGLAWIAMEYLAGHDLSRFTAPATLLPVAPLLRIAARVADALAHAHGQGVVHRDVKPANVMVDEHAGSVKVTDFGIARIADASRTRTGIVLGTPSFMSPEQLVGLRVDGRSDLYALGVTLFQLLSGRLPHEADSLAALMRHIAQQPAPDLRSLRPELPEALAALVALTLEKRPEQRPADGHRLAAALRAIADAMAPAGAPPADR